MSGVDAFIGPGLHQVPDIVESVADQVFKGVLLQRELAGALGARPPDAPEPDRRAVIGGELVYTSVSALQKADALTGGCLRAWRYRYVERLPDKPPSKGVLRGKEGHARIADFLKTGLDRLDRLERLGLPHMPPAGDARILVEHPLAAVAGGAPGLDALGVPMIGFIDLVDWSGSRHDGLRIVDWKFRKDLAKYGARAADLALPTTSAGIQMLGYAEWARRSGAPDGVRLQHVEFQWVGRADVVEAHADVRLTDVAERWETVSHRTVPLMREAARAPTPHDVKPNFNACRSFGGCPYLYTCLDPSARIAAYFTPRAPKEDMSLLDALRNGKTPSAAPPAPPAAAPPPPPRAAAPPPPPPAPAHAIIDVPPGHILARDAIQGAQYYVHGEWTTFSTMTGGQASFSRYAGGAPLLVSPDLPVYPAVPASIPPPLVTPPDLPAATPPAPPAAAAPPAPPTSNVLRLPGSAPTPPAPPAARAPKAPKPPKADAAPTDAAPSAEALKGVHLYFGCSPVGVKVESLSTYVDQVQAAILEGVKANTAADAIEQAACDLRMAGGKVLGFGMWKGWIPSAVQARPPAAGHYLVIGGDERIDVVASTLAGMLEPGAVVVGW